MSDAFGKKLQAARTGTAQELSRLLNERDPAIVSAMLLNPNMTSRLAIQLIRKKSVNETHIHILAGHKEWQKDYNLKFELILNPITPRNISLKLIQNMMLKELALIARKVTIHPTLREVAVNILKIRLDSMRTGEKITLARTGPIAFLHTLMEDDDNRIFEAALMNYRMTEEELIQFLAPSHRAAEKLDLVMENQKWGSNPRIMRLLAAHKNLGYASRRRVLERVALPLLTDLIDSPMLDANHRSLARFVLTDRFKNLPVKDLIQLAGSPSKKLLFYLGVSMHDVNVADVWLSNPRINVSLCRQVYSKNRCPEVKEKLRHSMIKEESGKPEQATDEQ